MANPRPGSPRVQRKTGAKRRAAAARKKQIAERILVSPEASSGGKRCSLRPAGGHDAAVLRGKGRSCVLAGGPRRFPDRPLPKPTPYQNTTAAVTPGEREAMRIERAVARCTRRCLRWWPGGGRAPVDNAF